ncbi:30S ribosomal protein S16 [Desulforudis sp. 1088]|uniref:30S ribosomal protein S16 n=1 Tax=unclassified Candidatus Desulforudis TaxID=2635950 RepID=UPI00346DEB53
MAVKIRLKRMGAKHDPYYRIVVADARSPRDGRFIEEIGFYDPLGKNEQLKINEEKARAWMAQGAQLTDTVKSLFKKAGLK